MFATTASELLLVFRQDVDDASSYQAGSDALCLWKDSEILRYMTASCDALAKKTQGIYKTVRLTYAADQQKVTLPGYVLEIRNVRDVTQEKTLTQANTQDWAFSNSADDYGTPLRSNNTLFRGTGLPSQYVRDYDAKGILLVPTPAAPGELDVQCCVTIAARLEAGSVLPFTDSEDLLLVLDYMRYLAYKKPDAETEDLVRSNSAKAAYEAGAANRASSLNNYRRAPGVVRMSTW